MRKDDFIKRERTGDEERRRKFLNEKKTRFDVDKIKGSVRGSLSREKLADAGERVRGAIQKAARYEPSERVVRAKEAAYEVASTVREEIQEAGDYYTSGGRRSSRRERRQRFKLPETESDFADYYEQQNIANFAAAFSPPAFRLDWSGRPTGRRYESDVQYDRVQRGAEPEPDSVVFENPYASYLSNFDPYARHSSGNRRQRADDDIISRWFY
ncbi:hypothetical protein [Nitrososphaera viennensis]|uniref:Uncharacterized protein n=2 Tax=Nitrososphaera viennensis TaxID=1034015 RepID=A0A060HKY8_9ARCH|nr:hypothetical protein [Nitrososphaera viennensis]AIC17184.1 hypothetical protein NVIE_029080 [Nitrososphaera viennensis EN76]UVS69073.1 hypothetical protein NWT39_14345 [Nitrososphaera viennensis]